MATSRAKQVLIRAAFSGQPAGPGSSGHTLWSGLTAAPARVAVPVAFLCAGHCLMRRAQSGRKT